MEQVAYNLILILESLKAFWEQKQCSKSLPKQQQPEPILSISREISRYVEFHLEIEHRFQEFLS